MNKVLELKPRNPKDLNEVLRNRSFLEKAISSVSPDNTISISDELNGFKVTKLIKGQMPKPSEEELTMEYWDNGKERGIRLDLRYGESLIVFSGNGNPKNPPLRNLIPNKDFQCKELSLMSSGQVVQTLNSSDFSTDYSHWTKEAMLRADFQMRFSERLEDFFLY